MVTPGEGGPVAQRPAVSRRPCRQTTPGLQPSGAVHPGVGHWPPRGRRGRAGGQDLSVWIGHLDHGVGPLRRAPRRSRHSHHPEPGGEADRAGGPDPSGPPSQTPTHRNARFTPDVQALHGESVGAVESLRLVNPKTFRPSRAERRLEGLHDMPRPGAPREIDDDKIAETVRGTPGATLTDATLWRLRSMARTVGHSPSTSHRIWQAFGLQPHRAECHVGAPFTPPFGRREPRPVAGRSARLRLEGQADSRTCAGCA